LVSTARAGWPLALAQFPPRPAPLRAQQQGKRLQRAARHNPWNAPPLTLAYTRRAPTLTSCRGEVNGPLSSLIRQAPHMVTPDRPTLQRDQGWRNCSSPLQHFLAMAAPVEVVRGSPSARCRVTVSFDQRSKINLGPFGPHAVEEFASLLLPGAIEIGERRQKRGMPLLVAQRQKLGSRSAASKLTGIV
jgi:hypothetical protein